ncbi:hypothetical protein LCI18_004904 [Fusarium solani-melongenae]|uniref:Uncharacterized protein n=1 Tax=Fusarium solani subsp. cucurbitae TaxID=2747967 RepID=A0ACD3YYB6_FUSSC|nr:hypothetical protein LCI18_004904 [Fusarium solani-melongenae]
MASKFILAYKWRHPTRSWTCEARQFDKYNHNVKVKLRIPWIMWPGAEEDMEREDLITGEEICRRADLATEEWAVLLRKKVDGEEFPRHEAMSCIIQMHETLLHTIYTTETEFQFLRLFYACCADRVAQLSEVTGLSLGRIVRREPNGVFRINPAEGYTIRLVPIDE